MSSKRNICSVHDDIINLCTSLSRDMDKCRTDDSSEDLYSIIDDVRWKLDNYIISYAEEAKEYGQSMENRLSDYKGTIEGLGFVRDKG